MKHILHLSLYLILALLFYTPLLHGRSLEEENEEVFSKMDQSPFKGKILLNKAVIIENLLRPFENQYEDKEGAIWTSISADDFNELVNIAERGSADKLKKSAEIDRVQKKSQKEIDDTGIIPIGIFNLEAILLTDEQVEENISARESGKAANYKEYKAYQFTAAGPFCRRSLSGGRKIPAKSQPYFWRQKYQRG